MENVKSLMTIQSDISKWDGKSASDITEIYERHYADDSFISIIVNSISDLHLQKGGTWLLKHYLENDHKISPSETSDLFNQLTSLEHWESKLHILQSLPFLTIPKSDIKKIEHFLRKSLMETNKFIRAWSYNGFYELAMQYPEYKEETKQFFEMAMKDEAPSVISRIRNIIKKGF